MTNRKSRQSTTIIRGRLRMGIGMSLLLGTTLWCLGSGLPAADRENDAAVKRTRRQVKMLDDLYKTAVVLITQHYVTEDSALPGQIRFDFTGGGVVEPNTVEFIYDFMQKHFEQTSGGGK